MNELLKPCEETIYNDEVIKRGGLIRVKCKGWTEVRNGIVTYIDAHTLKILSLTTGTACSYIKIPVADIALWEIKYSTDLETIYEIDTAEAADEPAP